MRFNSQLVRLNLLKWAVVLGFAAFAVTFYLMTATRHVDAAVGDTVPQSVQKGVDFLTPDVVNWTKANSCIACHRQGGALNALSNAKANGYLVDTSKTSGIGYVAQKETEDQQADGRWTHFGSFTFSKTSYALFGMAGYDKYVSTEYSASLVKAANWAISNQQVYGINGYWYEDHGSFPTTYGNVPVTARMMVGIAQAKQRVDSATAAQYQQRLDWAANWIRSNLNGWETSYNFQLAYALIGLKAAGAANTDADVLGLRDRLLGAASTPTGRGWGYQAGYPADEYNTGIVLYALGLVNVRPAENAQVSDAINWLRDRQINDSATGGGYWNSNNFSVVDIPTTFAILGLSSFGELGVELTVDGPNRHVIRSNVEQSQTVTYNLNITNHGAFDVTDTYNLSVQGGLPGWTATINPYVVTLASGQSAPVTLTVTAPPGLPEALPVEMTVVATSQADPKISANTKITTYTDPPPPTSGDETRTSFVTGPNAVVTSRSTAQPLAAQVKDAVTNEVVRGQNKGVVTFYVAGVAIGTDRDADGDGLFHLDWIPGSAFQASGTQDLRAVYSGIDLTAPQTDLLPSFAASTITISFPANQPPTVNAGGPYLVSEGGAIVISATGNNPEGGALTYTWDLDNDGTFETPGQNAVFSTQQHSLPGSYTVKAQAATGAGLKATGQTTVNVQNVAPVIATPLNQSASEGSNRIFDLGWFSDPGPDSPWTVNVDWGDGSLHSTYQLQSAGALGQKLHLYADSGLYTATLSVMDSLGASDVKTFRVNVANVPPVVLGAANQQADAGVAKTFSLGSFTDPGPDAPWSIDVNWGDGSQHYAGSALLNLGQLLPQAHTYAENGVYTITVKVIDKDGGVGSATFQTTANDVAVVRHAPTLNSGRIEGAVYQLTGEDIAMGGGDVITNDLKVPGTPTLKVSGNPTFGGLVEGTGSVQPSGYQFKMTGTAQLGHLITRTDPVAMPFVAAPPSATGTRDLTLNSAGQSPGDFATIHNLTLGGNIGMLSVPPGTYNILTAGGSGNGFRLGVASTTQPSVYNLNAFALNGQSRLELVGPVLINLATGLTTNGTIGSAASANWLRLNIAQGNVKLDGGATLYGTVAAPSGTITITGHSTLIGGVFCDRLTINGGGVLRLQSGNGGSDSTDNRPPTANAGADQSITLPTLNVNLSGTASDDGLPTGSHLSTVWSEASGPGTVTFADAGALSTTTTFSGAGTYVLRLTASDSLMSASDDLIINISADNQAPSVNAGPDQSLAWPTRTASLNGTASDDGLPSGQTLNVSWTKVSGPGAVTFASPNQTSTTVTFASTGVYVLRLTANDSQLSSADEIAISISAANQPPSVNAGPDQTITLPTNVLNLNGVVNDDGFPNGSALAISWKKISGPGMVAFGSPNQATTSATFSGAGTYVLRLTASDSELTNTDDLVINVNPANQAPTVQAGPDQTITLPHTANLQGMVSDDGLPVGSALSITWTKVSGPGSITFSDASATAPVASFSLPGNYLLRLTASDTEFSINDELRVTVNAANQAPSVDPGQNQTITLPNAATLHGTVTDDGLPQGSTLAINWTAISGPGTVTFSTPNRAVTDATFSAVGAYVLRLTASDSELITSQDVSVTVNPGNQPPSVNAGPNQTILLPAAANLVGTVSDDGLPVGGLITVIWEKSSGPGAVTFSNPNQVTSAAVFSAPGTYVLRLSASDSALSNSSELTVTVNPALPQLNGGTLIVAPASAGPNVTGTSQTLMATLKDANGLPLSGISIGWSVSGSNQASGNGTTDASGAASFTYTGAHDGSDTVQATASSANTHLQSNTASINWVTPTHPVSTTTVTGRFYASNGSGVFSATPDQTPAFSQSFPTINFNPPPETIPGNTSGVGTSTRPMVNVTTDLNGNYTGTIIAQGNGQQAGTGALFDFNAVFTGKYTVAAAGDVTFNFYSDDGFIFGIGGSATRVGGASINPPGSGLTPFEGLPVMGDFNEPTSPVANSVTVHFPAAGTYSYEVDYSECCGGELALTMTTSTPNGNRGVPPSGSLTLSPNSVMPKPAGGQQSFNVVAADASGAALSNLPVTLRIAGVNTQQLNALTDASGRASFTYRGFNQGNDTLQATAPLSGMIAYSNVVAVPWQPPSNQAPIVNAGQNQTITLPANTVNLSGTASDDGLPTGSTLGFSWSVLSGPATVAFSNANSPNTTATFSLAGTYVLRLTASDSQLSGTGDVSITVNNAAAANQPPTVDAGASQAVVLGTNLVQNPGNESPLVNGEIPGWVEAVGASWTQATAGSSGFPQSFDGNTYFFAGDTPNAELSQDIDVNAYTAAIAAGTQQFEFKARVRTGNESPSDNARIILEYRSASNTAVVATLDSGPMASVSEWLSSEDTRPAPVGTGWIRIRLLSRRNSGTGNDGYFDALSLRALTNAGVKLSGAVTDDGLPAGGSLTADWSKLSGPGVVTFADSHAASTTATFSAAGAYVLRLTGNDSQLTASKDVTVTVTQANQPPSVNAGPNQTITLPNTAALNGTASDDGLPAGGALSISWSKVSGPGPVTFSSPNQALTTASFSTAGTYLLRLSANDSELNNASEVTITVNPNGSTPTNHAPVVSAGLNQTISLPTNTATLNGTASDDGLPDGSTVAVVWNEVSGPSPVTFANAHAASTMVTLGAAGTYLLRLTASDSQLSATSDVTIILKGANQAPTVNAGPDQTVTLADGALLTGTATDDGLPAGSTVSANWSKLSGPGIVTFSNPGTPATSAAFSEAGTYVLRLTATDSLLSNSDDVTINVGSAQAPPTVEIISPDDGAEASGPLDVNGSVSNGAWRLQYSLLLDETASTQTWTTFANGTGPVMSGRLGTLDPTIMLNGIYSLRLIAADNLGQTSVTSISVVVNRNMKVGNFSVSFKDLSVPLTGLPIHLIRSYDSREKRTGDFGIGWSLGLDNVRVQKTETVGKGWYETVSPTAFPTYCLQPTRPHTLTVTFPTGKVYKFQALLNPQCQRLANLETTTVAYSPLPGTHGSLSPVNGGEILVVGSVPGPVDLVDFNDPESYYYNPTQFRLTAEDGTVYLIEQGVGVKSVTDPNGNTLTVDRNGITHSDGTGVSFLRDAQGRIQQITDPNGHVLTYQYDANGNLDSFKDAEGNVTKYTYTNEHFLQAIQVTSSDGLHTFKPVTNNYENGRLVSQTDANGKTINYNHDLLNRRETVTDRLGNPTIYEYDADGNVVYVKDAEGAETRRTYDARGNMLTETNALGTTVNVYDGEDNLTQATDQLGNTTRYTYNGLRKVTSTTDPRGNVTLNTYNEATGNLLSTRDAEGNETQYSYSLQNGRLQAVTRIAKDDVAHPLVTSYGYYPNGRLKTQTDPLGNVTTYTFDANGNRLSEAVTRTTASGVRESLTTSFEYDNLNRPTRVTYPDGSSGTIAYDEVGQKTAIKDQLGRETRYEYDEEGQLIRTIYPDGKKDESKYDAAGRVIQNLDREANATNYAFDKVGRPTETLYVDGGKTTTVYDAVGRVREITAWLDATHKSTTAYRYDAEGRNKVVYLTDPLNHVTKQVYDEAGNLWKVTDANNHTTTYEYDKNNRRTRVIYPDGTSETTSYNGYGEVIAKTDQAGKTTQYKYDQLDRMVKAIDALNLETSFTYDELGHQTSQTDANNHTTRFEYDKLGRRVKRTLPEGMSEVFAFDALGNLRSRTDFNGKTTLYDYDELNRLKSKTPDASFGQPAVTYTYTAGGRRASMVDATGTTTYTYDSRGRLKSRATPEGTLTYSYDRTGNMLSARSSNAHGLSVDYTYDQANRLTSLTDNNLAAPTGTTTYTYDDVGNALNCEYGNGLKSSYTYNALNRLTDVTTGTPTSTIASYAYVLGNAGNRLSMTEQSGRAVTYSYDDLYRLTDETIGGEPNNGNNGTLHYGYDNVGNRLNRTSSVAVLSSVASTFDKNDRLASDSYDANGNTSAAMGAFFIYDFEDHLADVNQGGITYLYDGDGNRVAKKVAGTTIKYLVDTNNPTGHPQVSEEIVGGSVRRTYTYGRSLVSQNQLINNQWAVSFYGKDGHGNVRYLTDGNGSVTDRYDYDAFGNLIKQVGSTPNDYLFASEQYDAHLGMTYLRARYLNAQTGRFLTVDPYMGDKAQPQSLHRYSYVANDPVNKLDPTGKMLEEELEVISIEAELDAGSTQLMLPFEDVAIDAASEAEAAGEEIANEFVVEDQLEAARTLGQAGEDAAGIVKNTERIESLTNTSNYRIPDELDRAARMLGEVKNVARLGRTRQLLDFALYARQEGLAFRLFVRAGTRFSGPLQELIEEYGIEVIRNLP